VGSFSQAFPVSGSFSRSAVNINAGAGDRHVLRVRRRFVLADAVVPDLAAVPLARKAVLAAVIIMAVVGLINFKAVRHVWRANRHDGIAAVATFIATLAFGAHLDNGIIGRWRAGDRAFIYGAR